MTTPTPPPGWHPDPANPNLVRYWDGMKWTDQTNPRFAAPAKKSMSLKQVLAIVGAVIVALGLYIGYHAITGPSAEEKAAAAAAEAKAQASEDFAAESAARAARAIFDAESRCEQLVADRLKAPAAADFSELTTKTSASTGELLTTGTVDSENSFGANIRSTFTCVTRSGTTMVQSIN